jgi:hypothetical protein
MEGRPNRLSARPISDSAAAIAADVAEQFDCRHQAMPWLITAFQQPAAPGGWT